MKNIKKLLFFASLATQIAHTEFAGNRDYPFYQGIKLSKKNGFQINSSIFTTKTLPIIEEHYGDKVQNPWGSYQLVDLNNSLAAYNSAKGLPVIDYLADKKSLSQVMQYKPSVDTIVDRATYGVNLEAQYLFEGFFDHYTPPVDFFVEHKEKFSNMDLFLTAGFSVIGASSVATYQANAEFIQNITSVDGKSFIEHLGHPIKNIKADLNAAVREMHSALGQKTRISSQYGLSDISIAAGFKKKFYYTWRCREIDLIFAFTGTIPTGEKKSAYNAMSFDFGHEAYTLGTTLAADVELRHGLYSGLYFNFNTGYRSTRDRRIAMGSEPMELSPLVAPVKVSSGTTTTISPYIKFDNIKEGLNLEARFIYKLHGKDSLEDTRTEAIPYSFIKGSSLDSQSIEQKKSLAAWSTKYMKLDLSYTAGSRLVAWSSHPELFASYEHPFGVNNTVRNRRLMLGMKVNF